MHNHARNVRILYKTCFKLHRGLPHHLKAIGDAYVRDEFKRHLKAEKDLANVFMEAWAKYALTLTRQLDMKGQRATKIGQYIDSKDLDQFSAEQLQQLYELYQESSKPQSTED